MKKSVVRKMAMEQINEGKTHQETFDAVYGEIQEQPEIIARIIRYIPTLEKRWKYRNWRIVLIISLLMTTLLSLLGSSVIALEMDSILLPIVLFMPLFKMFLIYGVVTHKGDFYKIIAFVGLIGLIRSIPKAFSDTFDPWMIINLAISALTIGVSYYLHLKIVGHYNMVKEKYIDAQGQKSLKTLIQFEE